MTGFGASTVPSLPGCSWHRAAAALEEYSCEFGSMKYCALCGFSGVLSCGLTVIAVVLLDLVKCQMQVDPQKYKAILNGFSDTPKEDSVRGLAKGWAPTLIGSSMQELGKFGAFIKFSKPYKATCLMRKTPIYGAQHCI